MKTLIVIDMQNDFLTGSLKNEEGIKIIERVAEYVKKFEGPILFTRDTHYPGIYEYSLEGQYLPGNLTHCLQGTDGWMIEKSIAVAAREKYNGVVDKETFGYIDWNKEEYKPFIADAEELVLVGVCTDICVVSNVLILRAMYPNKKITVVENLTAASTPEMQEKAIAVMKSCEITII